MALDLLLALPDAGPAGQWPQVPLQLHQLLGRGRRWDFQPKRGRQGKSGSVWFCFFWYLFGIFEYSWVCFVYLSVFFIYVSVCGVFLGILGYVGR